MPDRAAPPPEAGTPDFDTPLASDEWWQLWPLLDGGQLTRETERARRVHESATGNTVRRVRLTPSAPEPQDSGVQGHLPASSNAREGGTLGNDGSPLSTTGLDTRRTTVPASSVAPERGDALDAHATTCPVCQAKGVAWCEEGMAILRSLPPDQQVITASRSAPSAREGERDRVLWLAKRLSWFDGLDEEEAIPDDFTLDMAWDHREPEARIICLKVAGAFVSEFERSLASRPVSGPGTVTEEMVERAWRSSEHTTELGMAKQMVAKKVVRRMLAAALGGGDV
jgi:hypothetical protein